MGKVLLREYYSLCSESVCNIEFLNEEEKRDKENGFTFLTGLIQKCGVRNANGRIYNKNTMLREVEAYQRLINRKMSFGCLDHEDKAEVSLANASHIMTRVWVDGDSVYGVLKLLRTPSGDIARGIIESGATLGISSRALGSLRETPQGSIVQDDLQILAWDLVSFPSTDGAILQLKEAKEYNYVMKKPDRVYRALNNILWKK